MPGQNANGRTPGKIVIWLLVEITVYAVFVVAYYFLVLLFLRDWIKHLFDTHKVLYAVILLPLIISQAAVLEFVTVALRKFGRGTRKEKS